MNELSAPTVLLERERELARIAGRLVCARRGTGGLTVIEGAAGIGKTSLLRAARALAAKGGMQVFDGRGSELERDFAFGVVRQMLERPLADLDDAGRAAVTSGQAAHAGAVFDPCAPVMSFDAILHGLYWLVANLAERRPIVIAIDDAHWADEASVAALAFLAGRVEHLPVGLVVSTRPPGVDTGRALASLVTDPAAEHLRPEPLGESALATIGGTDDERFVRAALKSTGGNPFLVDQLMRELGSARSADAVARVEPREFGRLTLARISEPARAIAWALAILGERATLAECAALAAVEDPAGAAEELAAHGVFTDESQPRFRHPLMAAAVDASLPAPRRAEWHSRAATSLREAGVGGERLAVHLAATEPSGAAEVVDVLLDAARRALDRGATESAKPLLRRALAEPPDPTHRPQVLLALGDALAATGEDEADAVFVEAARDSADQVVQVRTLEGRARVGWARPAADVHSDLAQIDALIAQLPLDAAEIRLRMEAARLAVAQRSPPAMTEAIARAERIGLLDERGPAHPDVLAHAAHWRMQTGHAAAECVPLALRAVQAASDRYRMIPPGLWFPFSTIVLRAAERLDEVTSSIRTMQRATRESGSPAWYPLATQWYALLLRDGGELLAAEEEARLAVDASGAADEPWMRVLPGRTLVTVLLDRGELGEAVRAWSMLGLKDAIPNSRPMTELLVTRARLRDECGDRGGALADLREASRRLDRGEHQSINEQDIRLHTAQLEHAAGDVGAAAATAGSAVAIAQNWGTPGVTGAALRVQGRVEEDIEILRSAVGYLETSALRLEHARALLDLGGALRRSGERRAAREPLRCALGYARRCGAGGVAARAADELAATGERVRPPPGVGIDALTPSERRIARMAADSVSNKDIAQELFLSVKTVEMHLGNTYRKLDIASRRDLGPALAGLQSDSASMALDAF